MMSRRAIPLIAFVAALGACGTSESPTELPVGSVAGLAKGGGGGAVLYQAKLVVLDATEGEITSDWFPPAGFSVSANNPWKQVSFSNVRLNLNNYTHGAWSAGQCAVFVANFGLPWNRSDWDIYLPDGSATGRTYDGAWLGTVTFGKGYFAFDGDRADGAGGIHNVVTQNNTVVEQVGPNKDYFRQIVRHAPLKFGSASTPDGAPLENAEVACANYTIELRKMTLVP